MALKKPKPKDLGVVYDYLEASHYLEDKYDYRERDFAGEFEASPHKKRVPRASKKHEYLDFWHWVLKHHEVHNGGMITFSRERLEEGFEMPEWVKEIYGYYLDEFADEGGKLRLYTAW